MSMRVRLGAGAALFFITLAGTPGAIAQESESIRPPAAEAMDFLIGDWEGEGWSIGPDQQRETFDIYERIEAVGGGHGVFLLGEGYAPAGSARQGRPVHQAGGLVVRTSEGYEMRSITAYGEHRDMAMNIREDGFAWSLDLGGYGRINYVATVQDGVWEERGEFCRSETECYPNFYMRLERVE